MTSCKLEEVHEAGSGPVIAETGCAKIATCHTLVKWPGRPLPSCSQRTTVNSKSLQASLLAAAHQQATTLHTSSISLSQQGLPDEAEALPRGGVQHVWPLSRRKQRLQRLPGQDNRRKQKQVQTPSNNICTNCDREALPSAPGPAICCWVAAAAAAYTAALDRPSKGQGATGCHPVVEQTQN